MTSEAAFPALPGDTPFRRLPASITLNDVESYPEDTRRRRALKLGVEAAASMLPGVGGPAQVAAAAMAGHSLDQQRARWSNDLAARVSQLEQQMANLGRPVADRQGDTPSPTVQSARSMPHAGASTTVEMALPRRRAKKSLSSAYAGTGRLGRTLRALDRLRSRPYDPEIRSLRESFDSGPSGLERAIALLDDDPSGRFLMANWHAVLCAIDRRNRKEYRQPAHRSESDIGALGFPVPF